MDEIDTTTFYESWNIIDQPGCFLGTSEEYYRVLLAALDLGWHVEEPVYFRPRWDEGGEWVFHFILKKEAMSQPCLITLRLSAIVERLLSQEGWQVDAYPIRGNSYANHCSE